MGQDILEMNLWLRVRTSDARQGVDAPEPSRMMRTRRPKLRSEANRSIPPGQQQHDPFTKVSQSL